MIIMKFGGTSVGSAERIAATADIILSAKHPVVVVLSAMSGATNSLLALSEGKGSQDSILERHTATAESLGLPKNICSKIHAIMDAASTPSEIVACGELLSTTIMHSYLCSKGADAAWLPALDFMSVGTDGEPDTKTIKRSAKTAIEKTGQHDIYITQGFICRDSSGAVSTLSRGGSDYTATLLGEALGAESVQIWTDVDGVYTADPRRVQTARRIPKMSYAQADTAARRGAKILHPDCIRPAERAAFPVQVLDSFHPETEGTIIGNFNDDKGFVAIASLESGNCSEVSIIGHGDAMDDIKQRLSPLNIFNIVQNNGYVCAQVSTEEADKAMNLLHDAFINIK